jgi:hypothetical protein
MAKTIFKVGDKVWDIGLGWGEVMQIDAGFHYPIYVLFKNGKQEWYAADGRNESQSSRVLFFQEIPIPKEALERPRPDLKVDDRVLVRDDDGEEWLPRHFAGWTTGGLIRTFISGRTSWSETMSAVYGCYKLPEDE